MIVALTLSDRTVLALFMGGDSPALPIARHIHMVATWNFLLFGVMMVLFGTVRANGAVWVPLVVLAIGMVPVRFGYILATYHWLHADALWTSFPVTSAINLALAIGFYVHGGWKKARMSVEQRPDSDECTEEALATREPGGALNPAGNSAPSFPRKRNPAFLCPRASAKAADPRFRGDDGDKMTSASFPYLRMRRGRSSPWMRSMLAENRLHPSDFIWPLFICAGRDCEEPIGSLPGVSRWSIDRIGAKAKEAAALGIPCVALFPNTPENLRTERAEEALNSGNLICQAIKAIKDAAPEIGVLTDVALDPYTAHGHDGIVDLAGNVINDETVGILVDQALVQAARAPTSSPRPT